MDVAADFAGFTVLVDRDHLDAHGVGRTRVLYPDGTCRVLTGDECAVLDAVGPAWLPELVGATA